MQWLAPIRMMADAALPARCPGCGAVTREDHRFCAACWGRLRFLTPPWCARCNMPFAFDRGPKAICANCLAQPPLHHGILAAVAYGDMARALVLKLKYGGRTGYAETAAQHMRRLLPSDIDLLVPVPLHRWRLWSRGFNQAALIARAVGRHAGIPTDLSTLRRPRATPVLRGLGRRARAKAVQHAFALAPGAKKQLAGRSIGLIDDIYTSGATTDACIRQLMQGGARKVTVLCWARVLGDGALGADSDDKIGVDRSWVD